MSKKLYEETSISDIADAIREKNGTMDTYTVAQMSSAVRAIHTQPNLEILTATVNGNYVPSAEKDGFSSVIVRVEGGATIEPLEVTENGTYNPPNGVDGYAPVTVNVSDGINWKTQSQWEAMTFAEKKQQGLTLIGTPDSTRGEYFDYTNADIPYYLEPNNIIALLDGIDFNFHAFYSHTSGDRASAGGRGVTWNTNDYRVICNALPVNGGYGFYCAFALTQEALAGTNAQYYSVLPVDGYNMFCAGNISGAWGDNTDVTFFHNNTITTLQSMYLLNEYTIRFDTYPSSSATFNSSYNEVLSSIYAFLSDYR